MNERLTRNARRQKGTDSKDLARRLATMPRGQRAKLTLPDAVQVELDELLRLKFGAAYKRQEKRLASVLRDMDMDAIDEGIGKREESGREDAREFQRIERWRERLIEDDAAVAVLRKECQIDESTLTNLIAKARREREIGAHKGSGKRLFKLLADALAS